MLRWFSKLRKSSGAAPRMSTAEAQLQIGALGRLPQGVAEGRAPEPSPGYIEEAATPSEDAWAREQELYRRKQEQGDTPDAWSKHETKRPRR